MAKPAKYEREQEENKINVKQTKERENMHGADEGGKSKRT
jgi:hypothetical protein